MNQCLIQYLLYNGAVFLTSWWFYIPGETLTEVVQGTRQFHGMELWPTSPLGTECFFRTPNATVTGAKVLIPSLPKTGTTSMQLALQELGLRSYKLEDYSFYMAPVFRNLVGAKSYPGMPSVYAGLHGCKVDAVFTDSMDLVMPFDELYKRSPGAKVILCQRAFEAVRKSLPRFSKDLALRNYAANAIMGGWRVLPWLPLLRAAGFGLDAARAEGGPEIVGSKSALAQLWWLAQTTGHVHDMLGFATFPFLGKVMDSKTAFEEHEELVKRLVPPEDLLMFDVRKHGWKEVAEFLQIDTNVNRAFPNARIVAEGGGDVVASGDMVPVRDMWLALSGFIHLANFLLLRLVWRFVGRVCFSGRTERDKDKTQ